MFPTLSQEIDDWWQGWGQLTATGIKQHEELGSQLRQKYHDNEGLLSSGYRRDEVWVRSTDIDRTLMSATAQVRDGYLTQSCSANVLNRPRCCGRWQVSTLLGLLS